MKRIAISGSDGFIGQHVRFFLLPYEKSGKVQVSVISKKTFADDDALRGALASADVLIHLAGMNRGDDTDLYAVNVGLARKIIAACTSVNAHPHIVFASSVHATDDSAYGRSKREAASILTQWGKDEKTPVAVLMLPHVFGQFCKPYYNSAVATICHQIAHGEPSEIRPDAEVELIHAHDVARRIYKAVESSESGEIRVGGVPMKLTDVYDLLRRSYESYAANTMPQLDTPIERQLFATIQSYIFPKLFPYELSVKKEARGDIFEIIRGRASDQVFFSVTHPGDVRGNHYHTRKFERFCVVKGEGEIAIRKLFDETVQKFRVSGALPIAIDMPTFHTHNLTNVGTEDLFAVFWISEHYDMNDPDTYPEVV